MIVPIEKDNPVTIIPWVIYSLIILNVIIFLAGDPVEELNRFSQEFGFIANEPSVLNIFTSMFLHSGWEHLIGNMFFLYVFGDNVEEVLGRLKFILTYLLCGVVSVGTFWVLNLDSQIPLVGASGAISGVMGLYMVFFPYAHIDLVGYAQGGTRVLFAHLSARKAVLIWLAFQLFLGLLTMDSSGGIAFSAHVGGLVFGILLGYFIQAKLRINASKPNKELVFERDKKSKVWCPHCGREKYGQDFGSFTCEGCGTQFRIEKSDYYIEPEEPVDNTFDVEQYAKFEKDNSLTDEKSAVIFAQEMDKKVKYSAYITQIEGRIGLTILLSYMGEDRLVDSKEFHSEGSLGAYLRANTKFLISDFK